MSDNKNSDNKKVPDIFVTEDDLFDVDICYYKNNHKFFVKDIDEDFDDKKDQTKFTMTFKYPSQSDASSIQTISKISNNSEIEINDFMRLEFMRLLTLMRKWSIDVPLNNENVLKINPKIIRCLINKIRDNIGTEGII